jgi:hypothetical protein
MIAARHNEQVRRELVGHVPYTVAAVFDFDPDSPIALVAIPEEDLAIHPLGATTE